ncbi:MAG: thioredoxin-dependent thiol peroxidase [Chitinophagales bacterium]|nr:thioredoxin-dependent thiol peroxidase [Chitinophagales bacterium]
MLQAGDKIPDIDTIDQDGNVVNLSKLENKKLIIYFYPKDSTPGCTAEACNFRDEQHLLKERGYQIFGVSADSIASHQKFIEKHTLSFTLLSDENKDLIKAFGVWGSKKFMGKSYEGILRTTFITDEKGKITHVIDKVKTNDSTQQILDLLDQ